MDVTTKLSNREGEAFQQLMAQKELSESALLRHAFRTYQLVDQYLSQGFKILFRDPEGKVIDPFDHGPKMAPVPADFPQGF